MALLLGLFAAVCWALHDLAARRFAPAMGAARLGFRTEVAGFVILLPWIVNVHSASAQNWFLIVVLGVIYAAAIIGLFKAFAMAPVSIVGPFTAGYPALVVLWGIFQGDVPTLLQFAAVAAILIGAVVVGRSGEHGSGLTSITKDKIPQLIFWILLADFSFAASIILGQKLGQVFGDAETAGLLRFPAALVLLPFALREKRSPVSLSWASAAVVVGMGLLDVMALTGINAMGTLPNKELGAMGISAYGAIAVPLAMIWLKEKVSRGEWLGIALITAGIAGLGAQVG